MVDWDNTARFKYAKICDERNRASSSLRVYRFLRNFFKFVDRTWENDSTNLSQRVVNSAKLSSRSRVDCNKKMKMERTGSPFVSIGGQYSRFPVKNANHLISPY